jgi:hypothetical protein
MPIRAKIRETINLIDSRGILGFIAALSFEQVVNIDVFVFQQFTGTIIIPQGWLSACRDLIRCGILE